MAHAICYTHQTSGACNRMHQMERTVLSFLVGKMIILSFRVNKLKNKNIDHHGIVCTVLSVNSKQVQCQQQFP